RRLPRVRHAHHRANRLPGAVAALHHDRDERSTRDERDEVVVERLPLMLGVMMRREISVDRAQLHRDDCHPATFDARDDLADDAALDRVRFAQNQRAIHAAGSYCNSALRAGPATYNDPATTTWSAGPLVSTAYRTASATQSIT